MKLFEILDEDRFKKRWSDDELSVLMSEVERTDFSKEEMKDMAEQFVSKYAEELPGRTPTGIRQMLLQLHAIVHGKFPDGVIIYPGNWETLSDVVVRFGRQRGYDVNENYQAARENMEQRIASKERQEAERGESVRKNVELQTRRSEEVRSTPRNVVKSWMNNNIHRFHKILGRNEELRSQVEARMRKEVEAGGDVETVGRDWISKVHNLARQQAAASDRARRQ